MLPRNVSSAQKTWRKHNAAMILATQSIKELEESGMMQPFLQFADDLSEGGEPALLWLDYVHILDSRPEFALLFEVEPVALACAFDQHTEE